MKPDKVLFGVLAALILIFSANGDAVGLDGASPIMGLPVDDGFPLWLTEDQYNYLPLTTNQTSGLRYLSSYWSNDESRLFDLMMCVDDAPVGKIQLFNCFAPQYGRPGETGIQFDHRNWAFPPPEIIDFPSNPGNGYDWEGVARLGKSPYLVFVQEGDLNEINLYTARFRDPEAIDIGPIDSPDYPDAMRSDISNPVRLNLPDWNTTFAPLFKNNQGIEGIACSDDRLFLGLESPDEFGERLMGEHSTKLGIYKIDPDDPRDMSRCELLSFQDTADWKSKLGVTIETICGLSALDSHHLLGIDRDNTTLFAITFDDDGNLLSGRAFYLDVPGPAPGPNDNCPPLDHLPKLLKPSLESVAVTQPALNRVTHEIEVRIYLACDPWAPGWALYETDWDCPQYEDRLANLLPALYRYTVPLYILFPDSGIDEFDIYYPVDLPEVELSE
jgi:hypothetical protein